MDIGVDLYIRPAVYKEVVGHSLVWPSPAADHCSLFYFLI